MKDERLDYWVTGYGTGGTFHGAAKYIKEKRPTTKVILAEPGAAAMLSSGIKTARNDDGTPVGSHPAFSAHPIQGELIWFFEHISFSIPLLNQGKKNDVNNGNVMSCRMGTGLHPASAGERS